MIYCTTEHCSCMGIKQFSAGKAIRCTAESCENKSDPSCGFCKWYAEPEGVCVNDQSEHVADFVWDERGCNITYNYGKLFRRDDVLGTRGIRSIYGKTGAESIPILEKAISALGDDVDDSDYWHATEGNAKRALYGLLAFAKMRPDGVWDGD